MEWVQTDSELCNGTPCREGFHCVRPIDYAQPELCKPKWLDLNGGMDYLGEMWLLWALVIGVLAFLFAVTIFEVTCALVVGWRKWKKRGNNVQVPGSVEMTRV
jgi:hypothetical protein